MVGDIKPIDRMQKAYGISDGNKCSDCRYFVRREYAKTYFKCRLYSMGHGLKTDWRASWKACGKYEKQDNSGVPVCGMARDVIKII